MNDYDRLTARATRAAKGAGLATHQEARELVTELHQLRLVVAVMREQLTRRQLRRVRAELERLDPAGGR